MAVAVANTFLDVPSHKFLSIEGLHDCDRRSRSVPRSWKPVESHNYRRKLSITKSSSCSTQSELSDLDSLETLSCSSEEMNTIDHSAYTTACGFSGSPHRLCGTSQCCPCNQTTDRSISDDVKQTNLTSDAPAFKPMCSGDSHLDAAVSCIYLAMVSCGRTQQIHVEKGASGSQSTLITAELDNGPQAHVRSYEVIQLAKKSLEIITSSLQDAGLLSARVQKEDWGYSLRSSVVCIPDHARDSMCWDIFRCGRCPRRSTCRWYHPQDADIRRIKVSIRCKEEVNEAVCDVPVGCSSSSKKHKISLGELIP